MTRIMTGAALALGAIAITVPAKAQDKRTSVTPFIEISQVLTGDTNTKDVLTYSQVSVGIDGQTSTRRFEAQISYRFDQRIDWQKHVGVDQVHSGLARVALKVTPILQIEGGALATRARTDIRGATANPLSGSGTNLSQIYSSYVGPTLTAQEGPFGIAASYRFGATRVDAPTSRGLAAGSAPIDTYSKSTSQLAQASIGAKAGQFLPFGVSVSGAWQKENAGQLDQKYEDKFGRADVVMPIAPTLAVVAGAGYEDIKITQKDPVLDGTGKPITDSHGHFYASASAAPRIAYDTTGLFYDAGVVWRPSSRTTLQVRAGRRYDTMSYTGSFSHQTGNGSGFQVGVYDSIQSFGRQLRDGVAALPTNFTVDNGALGQGYSGCTFGTGDGAAGGCLNSAFQSITSNNYRARGVDGVFVLVRGPNTFGLGGGYANRRYIAPQATGAALNVDGMVDQSFYAQLTYARQLSRTASFNASLYGNYANPGAPGAQDVVTAGGIASLSQRFGRLGVFGSLGAYYIDGDDSNVAGQAQAGMRYQF
ncbi:hypothetical protein BH09PSE4_BH09PSE4_17520 [soil metagenome]